MGGWGAAADVCIKRWNPHLTFADLNIGQGDLKQVAHAAYVTAVSLQCGIPCLLCAGINNPCNLVERHQCTEDLCKRVSGLRVGMGSTLQDPTGRQDGRKPQERAHKAVYSGETEIFSRSAAFVVHILTFAFGESVWTSFMFVLLLIRLTAV